MPKRIRLATQALKARFRPPTPPPEAPTEEVTICAWLLGFWSVPGAIKLSHYAMNTGRTEGNHVLTPTAVRGLMNLIRFEDGYKIIIKHLLRLGLADQSAADPNYAELVLSGENRALDLRETHPDPAVDAYIESKFRRQIDAGKISPFRIPSGADGRRRYFFVQVMDAFERVTDTGSRNALIVTFTEIDRQFRRFDELKRITREQFVERIEQIFSHLEARVLCVPKRLAGLPDWLYEIADKTLDYIPVVNIAAPMGVRLYEKYFESDREAGRYPVDPREVPDRVDVVRGSLRLFLVGSDPYRLEARAREFFAAYAGIPNRSPEPETPLLESRALFSPDFSYAMGRVFPESEYLRQARAPVVNRFAGEAKKGLFDGVFGKASFEGYKVIGRAALFLALLREAYRYFPTLSHANAVLLRENLITHLELADPNTGELSFEKVNGFFTFLLEDSIGRGDSPLLREVDEFHGIKQIVGSDYERRTVRLLKAYPFVAPSFVRMTDEIQEEHLAAWEKTYYFNPGEALRLEGSKNAFKPLEGESPRTLAMLYYRSLLSYAAIPHHLDRPGTALLTDAMFMNWEGLRVPFFRLSEAGVTSESIHDEHLAKVAEKLGMPLDSFAEKTESDRRLQVTLVKLARQANAESPEDVVKVTRAFLSLDDEARTILEEFANDYPALTYFSSELYTVVFNQHLEHDKPSHPSYLQAIAEGYRALYDASGPQSGDPDPQLLALSDWMKVLVKVCRQVLAEDNFHILLADVKDRFEMRIHLGALLKYIKEHGTRELLANPLHVELFDNAYEISVAKPL